MFFARLTRIVAFLLLLAGSLHAGMGYAIAFGWIGPRAEALARYGGAGTTTGEMVDSGLIGAAIALALGTLADIALALRR